MTAGGFGAGAKQHLYAEKLAEYQRYYGQHPVCNPLLVEFVPPTAKRILDIGCNMGGAGRLLRQRGFQGEIWGVEILPELAQVAAQHYNRVLVGDVESESLWQQLPHGYFDVVLCGEVLEHLVHPTLLLRRLRQVVTPDATLVITLPHVGHAFVLRKLLRGAFDYEPTGVLDESHLRFFSRKNLWRMLLKAGWLVTRSHPAFVPDPFPEPIQQALLQCGFSTPATLAETQVMGWALAARLAPSDIAMGNEPTDGLVSIIILNWNNLPDLRRCLDSVFTHTRFPFEVIIVDNGSKDGSAAYLRELVRAHRNVKVVLNEKNLGAPLGRNCGLAVAEGDFLVFLDSDTVVTEGWLDRLLRWMEIDPTIGMVGPCSNFASFQQIPVTYRNLREMHEFARQWCRQNVGAGWETGALISFCVLMRRSVMEAIGGMDPRFGLIMHEDIDHSLRARAFGFRCWLALDTFVHHYGNRSSGRLGVERMMDEAYPRFKEKWNLPPEAEKYRPRIFAPHLFDPCRRPPQPEPLYEPLPDKASLKVLDGRTFKPLLSLCMIVKDEAENLPRCLESVQGIVDEIIVVDTGSTDETPQIAEAYGSKVIRFEWTGSFSDARNESLKHARGEWILWLDADEALAEGKEHLLAVLERETEHDGFVLPMVSFVGYRSHREGHVHPAFRLFRNLQGIRFERNLHEQIAASIKKVKPDAKFGVLPVWIEHYGYLRPMVERKAKIVRNLELAKKDLRENPFDPFAWYNLAREYLRLAQWERAFYCFRRALLHHGDDFSPYLLRCLCDAVHCLMQMNRPQQALAFLREVQQLPVVTPDFWMLEGRVRLSLGDWSGAIGAFRRALQFPYQVPVNFDWTEGATSYGAWYWMGVSYQKMGQLRDSLECYGRSIQTALLKRRYYEPAIFAFVQLVLPQCQRAEDLLQTLSPFLPEGTVDTGHGTQTSPHAPSSSLFVLLAKATLEAYPLPPHTLTIVEQLLAMANGQGDADELAFVVGKMLLLQHRYKEAAHQFAQIPLTSPEGVAAWNLRLLAHALAGEWEEAFSLCADDPVWRWLLKRWRFPSQNGDRVEMAPELLPLVRDNFSKLLALLLQLQEFDRYEQALELLDCLVGDEREKASLLAGLYGQFGFWDLVLETLLPFAQGDGLDRESWRLLAKACQKKGLYDEAAAILLQLVQTDERKDEALMDYLTLASIYIAAGKSCKAQEVLLLAQQLTR